MERLAGITHMGGYAGGYGRNLCGERETGKIVHDHSW